MYRPMSPATEQGSERISIVLYRGEWIVKVMQECPPLLILRGPAKPLSVVFELRPLHEKNVTAGVLEAAAYLVRDIALHSGDEGQRSLERFLKGLFLPGANIQSRDFQDHLAPLCGQLRLNEIGEVAYRVHRLKFSGLELDAKARLDSHDQIDVIERVPFRNIRGR